MKDWSLGRVTPAHAITPFTKARQQDGVFSPKKAKNPHEINRDAPAFQDAEEFQCSTWNGWLLANDLGLVRESPWLEKAEGKQSVLYGAGPRAPGLGDPSSVLVGSREEILKFEFKCCFFCDRGEVRAREGRPPLPGSPQPSHKKPCLAQGRRMVQRTTGEIEEGVRLGPCQPLAQERGWTKAGEAVSLGTHSWMEHPAFHGGWIVQGHPLQDCPSSMG